VQLCNQEKFILESLDLVQLCNQEKFILESLDLVQLCKHIGVVQYYLSFPKFLHITFKSEIYIYLVSTS